jgi:tyrosinase
MAEKVVRRNFKALGKPEKEKFIRAILKLKADGKYDKYVIWHAKAMAHMLSRGGEETYRNAAHYSSVFLPWHRYFLLQLEQDLQKAVEHEGNDNIPVAIPYWDWTEDQSLPDPKKSPLWDDDFMGSDGNPDDLDAVKTGYFAYDKSKSNSWTTVEFDNNENPRDLPPEQRRLQRAFKRHESNLPTRDQIEDVKKQIPYDSKPWDEKSDFSKSFRRALEIPPHNRVHRWVGGHMRTGGSPNDPVFFLHHCYIDRIWAEWQDKHKEDLNEDAKYPFDGSITYPRAENERIEGQNRNDKMFSMNEEFDGPTVESVLDHHKLGYVYDFERPFPRIAAMVGARTTKKRTTRRTTKKRTTGRTTKKRTTGRTTL